ncbi:hypothetical protein VNO77_01358 [Canavalia gladiata]|uniref:Uncharacterized protein n=1 Tax=Canavalia gladiata TaxID=3824 RepID=A0AAN9MR29_CANGL
MCHSANYLNLSHSTNISDPVRDLISGFCAKSSDVGERQLHEDEAKITLPQVVTEWKTQECQPIQTLHPFR